MNLPIRVLVVDDSALVQEVISQGLSLDQDIQVVGTAANPYIARDKIIALKPDVITLDVEMPKMDGVEFLRKLMPQYPLPVIMVSGLTEKGAKTTLDSLEAGAIDFVTKPKADIPGGINSMMVELREKVKIASSVNVSHWKGKKPKNDESSKTVTIDGEVSNDNIIAIGASTGGTEAIRKVISKFPISSPGIVIVQHMPGGFTKSFAERLNSLSIMDVKEAKHKDRVLNGRVLIAPGGYHMRVMKKSGKFEVDISSGKPVSGHCPSVDILFKSVAETAGRKSGGIILTGMGSDGAEGMLAMRKKGARTIAQDENSSVVFGMPKQAYDNGGAESLVPIQNVSTEILKMLYDKNK